jgi:hypothetical protein
MADGAFGPVSLGLVEDHDVAAVGALPAGELVRAHIDDVAAGAVDLLPGKEPGLRFRIPPANRAFDNEFGHGLFPPKLNDISLFALFHNSIERPIIF